MAGILGLASGQGASLNQDLIDKLKTGETKAIIDPLSKKIENIDLEKEKISEIVTKSNELLETIKSFDLFVSGGVSAFDQKVANTTGDSVIFDAVDEKYLNIGVHNVEVGALAKRDVYNSKNINDNPTNTQMNIGTLDIEINGNTYTFDSSNKTYEQFAKEINAKEDLSSSIEEVQDGVYKLVIKSTKTGVSNNLSISSSVDTALELSSNNVQIGSNSLIKINNIEYNRSSNEITIEGGLKVTAVQLGVSTISIDKDITSVTPSLEKFAEKYNELVSLVDAELYSAESTIKDKASLRSMLESVKEKLFSTYGENDDLSIFNMGFDLDKSGFLTLDKSKLNDVLDNNFDDLKSLFLGVAEKEGLGTQLKTIIDNFDSFSGILTSYQNSMDTRETNLKEEKEKAIKNLDNKYELLALKFSAYGAIINQFESAFSGLKLTISQSTARN